MADDVKKIGIRRSIRKVSHSSYIIHKNEQKELRQKMKKVSEILKKPEHERTSQDIILVKKNPELVKASQKNARKLQTKKERILEVEDEPELLIKKCEKLAHLIKSSKKVVVYTGAGISTAASIPDYRGPNGVWTLLKQGHELSPQDLSDAEPTFTHMSLTKLFKARKVKHIVSQNCDGLHIRSGFPQHALSEVHGNMFIECCYSCVPHKEYVRLFDVTERTGVHRHATSRHCRSCRGSLQDTIVHFGEKGKIKSPYRWKEAVKAAKRADLILCLGSSLKVLRQYSCLWGLDIKPHLRPKLVIVNLQWTPKDDVATLKINGKCDSVMMNVMGLLGYEVSEYRRQDDPIFQMCTPLRAGERKTTSKKILSLPAPHTLKSGRKPRKNVSKPTSSKRSSRVKYSWERLPEKSDVRLLSKSSSHSHTDYPQHNKTGHCTHKIKNGQTMNTLFIEGNLASNFNSCYSVDLLNFQQEFDYLNVDLKNSMSDLPENFFTSNIHQKKEFVTSTLQSEMFTSMDSQRYCMPQIPLKTHLQECDIQGVINYESNVVTCSCEIQQEYFHSSRENYFSHDCVGHILPSENDLSNQRKTAGSKNKNIPELVVVNLEKDDNICDYENRKDISTLSYENIPSNEVVLHLSSFIVGSDMSDSKLVLDQPFHANSFLSRTIHNVPHIWDNTSRSNLLKNKFKLSCDEAAIHVSLNSEKSVVGVSRVNGSNNLLISNIDGSALPGCMSDCEGLNYHDCYAVTNDKQTYLKNCCSHLLSDDLIFQPIGEKIKDIFLDHNYALPEATGHNKNQEMNAHKKKNKQNVVYVKANNYNQCSESTKSFIEDNKLVSLVGSLQSSSLSVGMGHKSVQSSIIELPHTQLISETLQNTSYSFVDIRQDNNIYSFCDVPSCIVNMDDMESICSQSDPQSEFSLVYKDHHVKVCSSAIESSKPKLPLNSGVLTPERTQLASSQGREHTTFKSSFFKNHCPLELGHIHFVSDEPDKNNTIHENLINCLVSNVTDNSDMFASCTVPGIVVLKPNISLLSDAKETSLENFKNKNDKAFVHMVKESLVSTECCFHEPRGKSGKRVSSCQLKNTLITVQGNKESQEEKNIGKSLHSPRKSMTQQSCSLGIVKKKERENVCTKIYKRKEASPGVPGWFGKGLLVKKRRKI